MKAPSTKTTRAALNLRRDPRVDLQQPLEKLASKLNLIEHRSPPVWTTGGEPLGTTLDKFSEGLRLFVPQRSRLERSFRPSVLEALLMRKSHAFWRSPASSTQTSKKSTCASSPGWYTRGTVTSRSALRNDATHRSCAHLVAVIAQKFP
jgi:hypothetical protein